MIQIQRGKKKTGTIKCSGKHLSSSIPELQQPFFPLPSPTPHSPHIARLVKTGHAAAGNAGPSLLSLPPTASLPMLPAVCSPPPGHASPTAGALGAMSPAASPSQRLFPWSAVALPQAGVGQALGLAGLRQVVGKPHNPHCPKPMIYAQYTPRQPHRRSQSCCKFRLHCAKPFSEQAKWGKETEAKTCIAPASPKAAATGRLQISTQLTSARLFLQATHSIFFQTKWVFSAKSSFPGGCLQFAGREEQEKCTARAWEGAASASSRVVAGTAASAGV